MAGIDLSERYDRTAEKPIELLQDCKTACLRRFC